MNYVEIPICANCVYVELNAVRRLFGLWYLAKCTRTRRFDPVSGGTTTTRCNTERIFSHEGECGPTGRNFERKD